MLSIPGHAEYYAKRIKDAQREAEVLTPADRATYGPALSRLLNEQMYGFETLKLMPSPETVRVLGEFLFDPWGLDPDAKPGELPNKEELGQSSHAVRALHALASMPLETRANSTPADQTQYWSDIDAWKLWYEQVRAGNRTFRFKGDPQNYSLAGPVAAAIEPVLRQESGIRPDPLANTEPVGEPKRGVPVAALAIAGALLAAASWYFVRSRSNRHRRTAM